MQSTNGAHFAGLVQPVHPVPVSPVSVSVPSGTSLAASEKLDKPFYYGLLKMGKLLFLTAVILLVMWASSYYLSKYFKKTLAPVPVFSSEDTLRTAPFLPGSVSEVSSDKTFEALMSGQFGPCVVMVYAEWCVHCKNMMSAFESAAKTSQVPFIKVLGPQTPVTCMKYSVAGYPTIFGVGSVLGSPRRFAGQRTSEALYEFSKALKTESGPSMLSQQSAQTGQAQSGPAQSGPQTGQFMASDLPKIEEVQNVVHSDTIEATVETVEATQI